MKQGIAFALASAVLFGMSTPLAKLLTGAISPLTLAGLLYVASGAGLMVVLFGRALLGRHRLLPVLPAWREWPWPAAAIFFGGFLGRVALMYGLATTAASTALLLLNLEAVFTALLAWFVFHENFDGRVALGMLAIVAGGVVLAWTSDASRRGTLGLVFIAAACFCWALDNNFTRKVSAGDAVAHAGIKGLVAGSVNLAFGLAPGHDLPGSWILAAAAVVGFLGYAKDYRSGSGGNQLPARLTAASRALISAPYRPGIVSRLPGYQGASGVQALLLV